MRRLLTLSLCAALLVPLPAPVAAQTKAAVAEEEEEEEDPICLSIGRRWVGTAEERRNIESRPVPDSFRNAYFETGCTRFSLIVDSFGDWHLQHGTAQPTLAAIDFFEADAKKNAPGKDWLATLPATLDKAEEATTRFLDKRHLTLKDLSEDQTWRAWQKLPEIQALYAMSAHQEQLHFIANEYARAAEFFGDAALYKKAIVYHNQIVTAQAIIGERMTAEQGDVSVMVLNLFKIRFYRPRLSLQSRGLSLAVTNAFIRRDSESILAAHVALNDAYDADYEEFRQAVTHYGWREAWHPRDGSAQQAAYLTRPHDNFFTPDVTHFFVQRSRLMLLAQAEGVALSVPSRWSAANEAETTLDMLERRDRNDYSDGSSTPYSAEFIRLSLLYAETDLAMGTKQCAASNARQGEDGAHSMRSALDRLIALAAMTNRVEQARLYLRVARTYRANLPLYAQCDSSAAQNEQLFAHDRLFAADIAVLVAEGTPN